MKCEVSLTVVSAGSSVIDAWPLTRAVQDTMQVPHTHDRPVVQVILFIYLFIQYDNFIANINTIALGMFCGTKYTHHIFMTIIRHH